MIDAFLAGIWAGIMVAMLARIVHRWFTQPLALSVPRRGIAPAVRLPEVPTDEEESEVEDAYIALRGRYPRLTDKQLVAIMVRRKLERRG